MHNAAAAVGPRGTGEQHSVPTAIVIVSAITLAFVGSVISETVASNAGIGYLMLQAYSSFRVPLMFAGLLAIAVIAIIMYGIAVWIEQRLTGWSVRGTENTTFTGGG